MAQGAEQFYCCLFSIPVLDDMQSARERNSNRFSPYAKTTCSVSTEDVIQSGGFDEIGDLSLNAEQQSAHDYVLEKISWSKGGVKPQPAYLFLSGSAGTGKSFLLENIVESLRRSFVRVHVVSCTGVAASNINARTIHSFLGFDFYGNFSRKENAELRHMDVLIIDEVSLLSRNIFQAIDRCMQFHKKSTDPFGGISVLLFGDLYQLMPVLRNDMDKPVYEAHDLWALFGFIELTKNMRQSDAVFVEHLNKIRVGDVDTKTLAYFNKFRVLTFKQTPDEVLRLFSTRAKVKETNKKMSYKCVRNIDYEYKNVHYQTYNQNVAVDYIKRSDVAKCFEILPAAEMEILQRPIDLTTGSWVEAKCLNGGMARVVFHDSDKIVLFGNTTLHTITPLRMYFEAAESRGDKNTVASVEAFPVKLVAELGINNEPLVQTCTATQEIVPLSKMQPHEENDLVIYPASNASSVPDKIDLCVGMVIMVTKNTPDKVCFNGMRCKVLAMAEHVLVLQRLDETQIIFQMTRSKFYFHIENDEANIAVRFGFPIEYAWACTIHKSQSLSVERLELDPQGIFGAGQLYVALSRVRRSNGLVLTRPITVKHVIVSEDIHGVYERLRTTKQVSK